VSEDVVELESPEELSYGPDGLLPVIVQDAETRDVLMLAYADSEAVRRTIDTKTTWFWSRSRKTYWNKGASSGNTQAVVEIRYDCDADALLVLVDPAGPACHTGQRSCFFRSLDDQRDPRSDRLDDRAN
jgi:phosphoribosyl-AMP cyclohydrolase